jgi:predicted esterase
MKSHRRAAESAVLAWAALLFLNTCAGTSSNSSSQPGAPSFPQVPGLAQRQVQFQQSSYPYYVFLPSAYDGAHALPAVLLIHGGGGNGPDFLALWKDFAQSNGIILVAPTVPLGGTFETAVAPQLYPLIMDSARSQWQIDARRIYLFGYSAGGLTVFDAAMFDSQYFAAAGVFAAVITPDFDWIVQQAQRKIPVAIYLGDSDQFFTLAQGRRTRDLLQANGFPVHYVEIPHQDHNYAAVANQVNTDVWTFFGQSPLSQ